MGRSTDTGQEKAGRRDRILGALGLLLIATAVVVMIGALWTTGPADRGAPPPIEIEEIARTPSGGIDIAFLAPDDFAQQPGGWGVRGYHLHASANSVELMPSPGEIRRIAASQYVWSLRSIPSDLREIRLSWSDSEHRPVTGSVSAPVEVP